MVEIPDKEYQELQNRLKKLEAGTPEHKKVSATADVDKKAEELRGTVQKLHRGRKAMLYVIRDLNETSRELRAAQEHITRSEKLAVIGKLAGIMSHEIRNPLGVIKNATYFLNMKLKDNVDGKIRRHLDILQSEVENADKIISDILGFARLKPPVLAKAAVNDIVEDALSRVTIPKNVKLRTELKKNLPGILVDASQIKQVFLNVILNATQAMSEGGTLTIATTLIDAGEKGSAYICVSFKDTGCGVPEENLNTIFEPLFSAKAKGVGLGLTACETIMEGHKGEIEVQSREGKGTTFTIKLAASA